MTDDHGIVRSTNAELAVHTHGGGDLPHDLFARWTTESGLLFLHYRQFPAGDTSKSLDGQLRARWEGGSSGSVQRTIYSWEHELALVELVNGYADVSVAAQDPETATARLAAIQEAIGRDTKPDDVVPITFWAYNPNGPIQMRRLLSAPTWDEVAENYAASTREHLQRLLRPWRPGDGGQLLLWSGKPGTGKTTAIRAFAREWADWADVHYIVDPDRFFGSESDYMLHVLVADADANDRDSTKARWRILLLEDAGELLTADARERSGQGLSRFLNTVDGLIGQGLRIVVLVTTNEDVRKLNPAVARPGRCAANIEFAPLSADESEAWLLNHDCDTGGHETRTLADLYAIIGERDLASGSLLQPLGFTSE